MRKAIGILTAWREHRGHDDWVLLNEIDTAVSEAGIRPLLYAFADLANGILSSIEAITENLLGNDEILSEALERLRLGEDPLPPSRLQLDTETVLRWYGAWAGSTTT